MPRELKLISFSPCRSCINGQCVSSLTPTLKPPCHRSRCALRAWAASPTSLAPCLPPPRLSSKSTVRPARRRLPVDSGPRCACCSPPSSLRRFSVWRSALARSPLSPGRLAGGKQKGNNGGEAVGARASAPRKTAHDGTARLHQCQCCRTLRIAQPSSPWRAPGARQRIACILWNSLSTAALDTGLRAPAPTVPSLPCAAPAVRAVVMLVMLSCTAQI